MWGITEILLFIMTFAILVSVFWERRNTHRLIEKNIQMAEGISKTFQKDAEVRGQELNHSQGVLYHVMTEAKEERQKYMEHIQVFADRFMPAAVSWRDSPSLPPFRSRAPPAAV